MSKSGLIWLIIILAVVIGIVLIWWLMPEHKRTFWKTFIKQIPYLLGRLVA